MKNNKKAVFCITVALLVILMLGMLLKNDHETQDDIVKENSQFPIQIPETDIVIRDARAYDGEFVEDGSDRKVAGVSAILIENIGETHIEYAKISVENEGEPLIYEVSALEAGSKMLVLESAATPYAEREYKNCSAQIATMAEFEMSEKELKITETKQGEIRVENISKEDIASVRIFYKTYDSKEEFYLGGITYTVRMEQLEAGGTRQIVPTHYKSGESHIVMVRTY